MNPLEVNPFQKSRKDQEHVKTERQKWFFCACGPDLFDSCILAALGQVVILMGSTDLTLIIIGWIIGALGSGFACSPTALSGIQFSFIWLPFIIFLISIIPMFLYKKLEKNEVSFHQDLKCE
nr:hypothetical protein [Paenibacillus maysiensis]